jgi:hypothetical protein
MFSRIFLVVLAPFLLSGLTPGAAPPATMKKFSWLVGTWKAQIKKGVITESWRILDDSTFTGENTILRNNGETSLVEKLTLTYRDGEYYYTPTVIGQNDNKPIPFKITSYNESAFVSENPGHDFPKRIIYQLVGADTIHATIDAGPSEPGKKADFYYSRIKN